MKRNFLAALLGGLVVTGVLSVPHARAQQAPVAADVIVVIDESGSMSGEQRWLGDMVPLLEENLKQYGIGSEAQPNQFGLVGYGSSSVVPRTLTMDGSPLGSAQQMAEASNRLVTSGGTEDGWRGIEYALDEYPRRNGAAVNIILATDEDRDNTLGSITYETVRDKLSEQRALLNAVVNARIYCGDGSRALGMDSLGTGYIADGSGGFTTCEGAYASGGSGRTIAHYVDLAMENGGAAWDLNVLRSGGLNAESFTRALLDIKVEEILGQRPTGDLVAVVQATPNPAVAGEQITLDGAGSFHQKDDRTIVRWQWDLNDDGTFDAEGPVVQTSFPELGEYPVTLKVTDDGETPLVEEATVVVNVDTPPLEPTANAGGPYLFCPQNQPWFLDGSRSANPDDGLSEEGQPEDRITAWEWDLDNDLSFDDASGELVDVTSQLDGLGTGDHLVRLRVTDNTTNAFPSSGQPDLTDTMVSQVSIRDAADTACNCLTDVAARANFTKVQLTWTDSGAHRYAIHRSDEPGGPYTQVATTDNRYSTYLDMGLELDNTYYYVVSELGTDGRPTCRSREVAVTPRARRVNESNRAPVIESTPVTEATEGVPYDYTVEASDPDRRDRIQYSLQVAPQGMTIDGTTGVIEWVPLNVHAGEQTVIVRVSDSQGEFAEQVFTVLVANVNQAPSIVSAAPTEATELVTYNYEPNAVDPDTGDQLTWALESGPAGMSLDPGTGVISWTPESGQAGAWSVTLRVTDSEGESDVQSFEIATAEQNYLPDIVSEPLTQAMVGHEYGYDVQATDQNAGDPLTYALGTFPDGMEIGPESGEIRWTPQTGQEGQHEVTVVASDDRGGSTSQQFTVDVAEEAFAPKITTQVLPDAREDQSYSVAIAASDDNADDTLTFSLTEAPDNMQMNPQTGEIAWLPVSTQVGPHQIRVRVTDGAGLYDEATFALQVVSVNLPPRIVSDPPVNAVPEQPYLYRVQLTDPDNEDLVSLTLVEGPAGMSLDSASGLLQWTPSADQLGSHAVRLLAEDNAGATTEQRFTVVVAEGNLPPTITSTPSQVATAGEPYQYQVVATDDGDNPLEYSLVAGPTGMSMTAGGLVSWSPADDQAGNFSVAVRVTDEEGASVTQSYTLSVDSGNRNPVITSLPAGSARSGQTWSYQVVASDPDGDALSYHLTSNPPGMAISGSGLVSWSPAEDLEGSFPVTIEVTDSKGGAVSQSFTLNLSTDNAAPSITSAPVAGAIPEETYQYQVKATDPEGEPLTHSLDTAPGGMGIDPNTGLITWTPGASQQGSHQVVIRVEDADGAFTTQSFMVEVIEENQAPTIDSEPVTSARPDVAWQYVATATDPDGDPLSWEFITGPAGMSITESGMVSWTPDQSQVGGHTVAVLVRDGRGGSVGQSFTVQVTGDLPPPRLHNTPTSTAEVGKTYQYRVLAVDAEGYTADVSLMDAPTGMTMAEENGIPTITWVPEEGDCTKQVTLLLTDQYGQTAQESWDIRVLAAPRKLNRIQCSAQSGACGGQG